jgi:L-serine dehydratase
MVAARKFTGQVREYVAAHPDAPDMSIRCTLKGSLAFTGMGHATDRAITLGLHGYAPEDLSDQNVDVVVRRIRGMSSIGLDPARAIRFSPDRDIVFDRGDPLPQHPNGMVFELVGPAGDPVLSETCFSIGGGFVSTLAEITQLVAPLKMESSASIPYPFESARLMLQMSLESNLSIARMKLSNERVHRSEEEVLRGVDAIWRSMRQCVEKGLAAAGALPGGLELPRRARHLHEQLQADPAGVTVNDWLSAYAMAVGEENAAGNMVVTAPTNGAAGVIPAVLYYAVVHDGATREQVRDFLFTASAIGGLIKHRSSISGAEVGCQGEVGSAAAMAAAGLCAVRGGTTEQIENAAEIALEHHLGMTCDPVRGLVQVPCIERNAFGAIKACAAASLALRGSGRHFMPLDNCIAAMKQTGLEMSEKFKETALGGLAVSITEC